MIFVALVQNPSLVKFNPRLRVPSSTLAWCHGACRVPAPARPGLQTSSLEVALQLLLRLQVSFPNSLCHQEPGLPRGQAPSPRAMSQLAPGASLRVGLREAARELPSTGNEEQLD